MTTSIAQDEGSRAVVICPLEVGHVVLDAEQVEGIISAQEACAREDAWVVDLSRWLDPDARHGASPDTPRRALVFRDGQLMLVIGERLEVTRRQLSRALALPPMLQGLSSRTGLTGLLPEGEDFYLVLDSQQLLNAIEQMNESNQPIPRPEPMTLGGG